jgi:arylformamidase
MTSTTGNETSAPDTLAAGWIDVSVTLHSGMVHWPGNPPVRIERQMDIDRGDLANVSVLSMGSHTGTHMDAPLHFIAGGKGLDEMDLGATLGRARVVEIHNGVSIRADELGDKEIEPGDRILFKTRNSDGAWSRSRFVEEFVYLSQGAARFLAERGVRTVGVDYLSVGGFERDAVETHQALLGAGIWIIEGLDLSLVGPGRYDLICLPLKVLHSDGAPARAILRPHPG